MLVGLAVFVAPVRLTQILILSTALSTACALLYIQDNVYQLIVNILRGVGAGRSRGDCVHCVGPRRIAASGRCPARSWPVTAKDWSIPRRRARIFVPLLLSVPVFALLVQHNTLASRTLMGFGVLALIYLLVEAVRHTRIERERLFVVLILRFFRCYSGRSSSRQAARWAILPIEMSIACFEKRVVVEADVGSQIRFRIPVQTDDYPVDAIAAADAGTARPRK